MYLVLWIRTVWRSQLPVEVVQVRSGQDVVPQQGSQQAEPVGVEIEALGHLVDGELCRHQVMLERVEVDNDELVAEPVPLNS